MLSGPKFMINQLASVWIDQLPSWNHKVDGEGWIWGRVFYVYTDCRKKCLEECIINRLFSWQKINIKIEHQKVKYLDTVIKRWIKSSDISLKFYFHPNNGYVITSFWVSPPLLLIFSQRFSTEQCFSLLILLLQLLMEALQFGVYWKWLRFETLHYPIPKFQIRLGEAISDLFLKLNYPTFRVPAAKQDVPSDGDIIQR